MRKRNRLIVKTIWSGVVSHLRRSRESAIHSQPSRAGLNSSAPTGLSRGEGKAPARISSGCGFAFFRGAPRRQYNSPAKGRITFLGPSARCLPASVKPAGTVRLRRNSDGEGVRFHEDLAIRVHPLHLNRVLSRLAKVINLV